MAKEALVQGRAMAVALAQGLVGWRRRPRRPSTNLVNESGHGIIISTTSVLLLLTIRVIGVINTWITRNTITSTSLFSTPIALHRGNHDIVSLREMGQQLLHISVHIFACVSPAHIKINESTLLSIDSFVPLPIGQVLPAPAAGTHQ